jgi:hypothetical protein
MFYIIAELVIALAQPYTFMMDRYWITDKSWWTMSYKYEVNDLLVIPIFIRSYVIFRFAISLSNYYDHRSDRIM